MTTPGPWQANNLIVSSASGEYPEPIALMALNGGRGDEALSNARLIAAAPTLLDALKEMRAAAWGGEEVRADAIIKAEAAIAKAEGR